MIITYKTLNKVKFPVFLLSSDNWNYQNGLLYLDNQILDDRKSPGKTLGARRLACGRNDLYPLKKSILSSDKFFNTKHSFFIDSKGMPFIYYKTKFCKIVTYKILKVNRKSLYTTLELKNCAQPILVDSPPPDLVRWAEILVVDAIPWKFYGYSSAYKKDRKKKI